MSLPVKRISTSPKANNPSKGKSEHAEQVAFITRVRWLHPELTDLVAAIPNGGYRDPKTAANLKAEGVLSGMPDILVAYPVKPFHGLFIELKKKKTGRLSENQKRVIAALEAAGYKVAVAFGADDAYCQLCGYLASDGRPRNAKEQTCQVAPTGKTGGN